MPKPADDLSVLWIYNACLIKPILLLCHILFVIQECILSSLTCPDPVNDDPADPLGGPDPQEPCKVECEEGKIGHFQYCGDCSVFLQCDGDGSFVKPCSTGTFWDDYINVSVQKKQHRVPQINSNDKMIIEIFWDNYSNVSAQKTAAVVMIGLLILYQRKCAQITSRTV